jgi:hypothetical protein
MSEAFGLPQKAIKFHKNFLALRSQETPLETDEIVCF